MKIVLNRKFEQGFYYYKIFKISYIFEIKICKRQLKVTRNDRDFCYMYMSMQFLSYH